MADTPTSEPLSFTAGDTLKWLRSEPDYSAADGWTLKYRLINASNKYDITAGASGSDHLVNVAATTTAAYAAGEYTWQRYVEKAGERYTTGTGTLTIKPDLAAQAAGLDTRSNARKILAELEDARVDYATNGQGVIQRYTIGGREMWFRGAADFVREIEYWRSQVQQEEAAESVAQGLGNPRRYFVRFG